MHSSTTSVSRYLESAGVAGCAVKKGSASNGVTAITATTDKPAGLIEQTKTGRTTGAPFHENNASNQKEHIVSWPFDAQL